jgi:FAD/FMN-containing dehydrogenase
MQSNVSFPGSAGTFGKDLELSGGMRDLAVLQRVIGGEVIAGDSAAYRRLPGPFNARFDQVVPEAVVRCASAEDVVETVSFVRRHGLQAAIRGGGHCFAGRSVVRGIVIDLSSMSRVLVSGGVADVGAGARLGEVYLGLAGAGLTIPGGSCPSVGVAGLTLGGGLGMLGRSYGLTCDHLLAAQIVLADGRVVRCDDHHEPELFWALRGAGAGNFGAVTELVFRPVPTPAVTVFSLAWPFAQAAAVTRAWLGWAGSAADEIAASLILAVGPDPAQPPTVELFGTMLGGQADAVGLLGQLTGQVPDAPASSLAREMTYLDALRHWAARSGQRLEDPRASPAGRSCHFIRSEFFTRPLPDQAVDRLLGHLAGSRRAGQSRELDFTPWGGAYSRADPRATAFPHREPRYLLKHSAAVPAGAPPAEQTAAQRWATGSWQQPRRWGTGQVFPNFADPDLAGWARAYYGPSYQRLLSVKARYDPDSVFGARQSLPAR